MTRSSSPDPYARSGVRSTAGHRGFSALIDYARKSCALRDGVGRPVLDLGAFANVLDLGDGRGLAISTDGVGTKLLIAGAMGRFDTVGIDCVAMNVNDILAVGAEPIAVVDYIAVESMDDAQLEELGKGLYEGVRQAGCSIPGGELAQVRELLHATPDGRGFDLVATAVGLVPLDRVIVGQNVQTGDVVYGLPSSGLHSNGYSLARRVLLDQAGLGLHDRLPELRRPLGEELLEPTRIYVRPVLELLEAGVQAHALAHITGDGLLNLARIQAQCGFVLDNLPEPPPVFRLIAERGGLPPAEMYRVFNMGLGYAIVAPAADGAKIQSIARKHGLEARRLGVAVADPARRITLSQHELVSDGDHFVPR